MQLGKRVKKGINISAGKRDKVKPSISSVTRICHSEATVAVVVAVVVSDVDLPAGRHTQLPDTGQYA